MSSSIKISLWIAFLIIPSILWGQASTEPPKDSIEKKSETKNPDAKTKMMIEWQAGEPAKLVWSEANESCKSKSFRLPTKEEFVEELKVPNSELKKVKGYFWTSSKVVSKSGKVWYVNSGNGYSYFGQKSLTNYVKCVKDTNEPKKTESKEEPVTKRPDNLMEIAGVLWHSETSKMSFVEGSKYCTKQGLRLPTREELQDGFKSKKTELKKPEGYYLSSTKVVSLAGQVWYVNSETGNFYHSGVSSRMNVRCVASPEKKDTPKTDQPSDKTTSDPKK